MAQEVCSRGARGQGDGPVKSPVNGKLKLPGAPMPRPALPKSPGHNAMPGGSKSK
jgi:hypothetical protein